MNLKEKLLNIQSELKAPKGQRNSFGNYNYRSCEDILEAVKPLCRKYNAVLRIQDDINYIEGRFYIIAEATLMDCESDDVIYNRAYAREEDSKKGMDGSQVTGASSSYARKYALNGLFAIDDTKDADTDEFTKKTKQEDNLATQEQKEAIKKLVDKDAIVIYLTDLKKTKLSELTKEEASNLIAKASK